MLFARIELNAEVATKHYLHDVRPIFERSCYACHGPEKQKSGYRLDVRSIALTGGVSGTAAIHPHDAANSPLVRYVSGEEPDMKMPPASSGLPALSAEEVATIRAWIDAGPSWPDEFAGEVKPESLHWSLRPLVRPNVPGVEANPIDAFVRSKLREKGLEQSPEADRRTLLRRVYFDLIGLPPLPEQVEKFVTDPDPDAYGKIVDELLASPRYGERWARHWLDTIHFADSHGYEHDIARDNAWRYRDYVISALNRDTPWERFIREQLAADVFYPDEPQLTPALGFLGAGTFDLSTYSTAPVTFDYLDRDDLVTQTMAAFVSTTANCARCHAHKFDPISQEDYYALQADFAGVLKGDVAYDEDPSIARARRSWIALLAAAERREPAALLTAENESRVRSWLEQRGGGASWKPLAIDTFHSAEGARLLLDGNGVLVSMGTLPEKDTYTITASTELPAITAIRLNVFAHESLPAKGPGRQAENGNFHLSEMKVRVFDAGAPEPVDVKIRSATADFNQDGWGVELAIDGKPGSAWGIHPAEGQSHYAVFELAEPLEIKPGAHLAVTLEQLHGGGHIIGAFNLAVTADPPERTVALPSNAEAALAIAEPDRSVDQKNAIAAAVTQYIAQDAISRLPAQTLVYAAAKSVAMPVGEPKPKPESLDQPKTVHLMERGEFDKPRDEVPPGALSVLTHASARFALNNPNDEGQRRAALAEWIAHPENVLTWRSAVNRVWHYHFGRGLCDTPSDFGEMGGTPSHPELIDWLAVWFRDEAKGSLKELHQLIVTSDTYKQSSQSRADPALVDGDNRLLWRQNRQRLDADAYRDFVLAVAGRLDLTMGGPGVKQFGESKGPQLTPALDYASYDWDSEGAARRGVYRFVWRGIPDPFMEALDFPDLGLLSPTRAFSASPLQALTLYNNEFVLHHSVALADRVQQECAGANERVARAARLTWLRGPSDGELGAFVAFAEAYGLPALCRVLLNSDEFLFID